MEDFSAVKTGRDMLASYLVVIVVCVGPSMGALYVLCKLIKKITLTTLS